MFTASIFGRFGSLPLGYLLLWFGLVVLTVVLIVMVVSRWGKSHPVATCGLLSLLAHVLLACVATIVRLVAGIDQVAEGPPIRVHIVDADSPVAVDSPPAPQPDNDEPLVVLNQTPKAESPSETAIPAPALLEDPPPADAAETADEPPTPADEPEPQRVQVEVPEPTRDPPAELVAEPPTAEGVAEVVPTVIPPEPVESVVESSPSTDQFADESLADVPSPNSIIAENPPPDPGSFQYVTAPSSAPRPYANRQRSDRLGFVEREGGSRETEAAVRAALAWLAAAQSHDGRWDASRFAAGQERAVLGHNRGEAGQRADNGVSALALLAFLGAGYTHDIGEYRQTVDAGLEHLIRQQAADGDLGGDATLYARMYCHSMATFALAEALAVTGDRRLETAVRRAVDYSVSAQHPASGGWRYRPGQTGDTSQLGWQLMALRSAELAGLDVPARTWTNVERFLRSVSRGRAGGLAAYRPDGPASRSMTAEALYCRHMLTEAVDGCVEPQSVAEATQSVLDELPGDGPFNLYYWYYATLALHHQKDSSTDADRAWRSWNDAMKRTLLATQVAHGVEVGSWPPETMWGGYGGCVYSTGVAALCLEVYYRYATGRTEQGDWIATEPNESAIQR